MFKHTHLIILSLLLLLVSSCKVEFSPNAEWRNVPVVYCILDPEEDTVWARVQRCYLGEDNLYNYSSIADSNYYLPDDIKVVLLAWKGKPGVSNSLIRTDELVDRWELDYTLREGKPDGVFPTGPQPIYYCVPGRKLYRDSNCVFQLVVLNTATGDTLAQSTTTMVGFYPFSIYGRDTVENILLEPSSNRGHEFGYYIGSRGKITLNTIPRGRIYQTVVTFYYRKNGDTLSIDIEGTPFKNQHNRQSLIDGSITMERFLSTIRNQLATNRDSLFNVNNVDVNILVGNEDLNAYISSQNNGLVSGQEFSTYTNIEGGLGIFASRRSHIRVNVPCDSTGKKGYIPDQLRSLGVGFYGNFGSE